MDTEISNLDKLIIEEEKLAESTMMDVVSDREIQLVQAQIISAKKFPRQNHEILKFIKQATDRQEFAKLASYSYPRGGQIVTGPSIRMAEMLARSMGNMDFGIRQLSKTDEESYIEAWCYDLERNTRASRIFTVPHSRDTKKGKVKLTDDRDQYEMVANKGARWLRACILQLIPGELKQLAIDNAASTIKNGDGKTPLVDRVQKIVLAFLELGVTASDLEERLGHSIEQVTKDEFVEMYQIYTSLKDSVTSRSDWFKAYSSKTNSIETEELNKKLAAKVSFS